MKTHCPWTTSVLVLAALGALSACGEELPAPSTDGGVGDIEVVDAAKDSGIVDLSFDAETADASFRDAEPDAEMEPDAESADMMPPEDECLRDGRCVTEFPFVDEADTEADGEGVWDRYPCKDTADESGPEVVYEVIVPEAGFLSAAVYDGEGVDVDIHILTEDNADSCISRGHHHAGVLVEAGRYFVVVDSFANGDEVYSGAYRVEIGLYVPSRGPCAMEEGVMPRVRDEGAHLEMPATGPMVLEAHLVTAEEPEPFPSTPTEELAEHYDLSQDRTGFVMHRRQTWAPLEGGSFYGAGIGPARLLPVEDESWYINMYWTRDARPDRGTRMILRLPDSDRAVVVSAGHETGPGDLDFVGGTPEEPHFYLGTTHRDVLTLGLAADPSLPLGPRVCED